MELQQLKQQFEVERDARRRAEKKIRSLQARFDSGVTSEALEALQKNPVLKKPDDLRSTTREFYGWQRKIKLAQAREQREEQVVNEGVTEYDGAKARAAFDRALELRKDLVAEGRANFRLGGPAGLAC